MNAAVLILKNLTRNPMRSVLTMAAVALPMALFVFTSAVGDVFQDAFRNSAASLRLAVHNKVTLIQPLPERLISEVRALDPQGKDIRAICGMTFFGGKVADAPPFEFPSIAADAESYPEVFSEYGLSGAEREEWMKTRNATVVGIATAEHYGWSQGQEIELRSSIPPYMRMRFKIVLVTKKGPNPSVVWCRRDYLDEEKKRLGAAPGFVNMIWIKFRDPSHMSDFARRIDEATANTPDETQTEDESTFMAGMIKSLGDMPTKIRIISYVVVLAIVMVVANTMSLTFRERTRELAALKALGFPRAWMMRMVMSESIALALVGGLAGILPAYLLTQIVPITNLGFGPMKRFVVPERTAVFAVFVVIGIGIFAGLMPTLQAARLKVVEALRKLG